MPPISGGQTGLVGTAAKIFRLFLPPSQFLISCSTPDTLAVENRDNLMCTGRKAIIYFMAFRLPVLCAMSTYMYCGLNNTYRGYACIDAAEATEIARNDNARVGLPRV